MSAIRIGYIDALRGFAILSVVYSHLIVMGMSSTGYDSTVLRFIQLFFMPLFFFISGYFSNKSSKVLRFSDFKDIIVNKTIHLLIPTFVMFSFCICFFDLDFVHYLYEPYKCGYWFTWVLFVAIFLFTLVSLVINILLESIHFRNKMGGGKSVFIYC